MALKLTPVIQSRSASGAALLYAGGAKVSRSGIEGAFSPRSGGYRPGMDGEFTHDRPWLGKIVSWPCATAP